MKEQPNANDPFGHWLLHNILLLIQQGQWQGQCWDLREELHNILV